MVERDTPPGSRIFTFSQYPDSYTTRELMVGFMSARNERLNDALFSAIHQDWAPTARLEFTIPRGEYYSVRIVQTAAPKKGEKGDKDLWSVAEFRIFDGDKELPRAPGWRLEARPNPWDVQLAFDNSAATRWRSWERLRAGMYISVDFGEARTLDKIRLQASFDQWGTKLHAEAREADGKWRVVSGEPKLSNSGLPLGLRRGAIDELKRDGVSYMLVSEDNFNWQDFRDNASAWGIRQVDIAANVRLYKLE
jgi:hypothetical protein